VSLRAHPTSENSQGGEPMRREYMVRNGYSFAILSAYEIAC